jgi:hypothetical protein
MQGIAWLNHGKQTNTSSSTDQTEYRNHNWQNPLQYNLKYLLQSIQPEVLVTINRKKTNKFKGK